MDFVQAIAFGPRGEIWYGTIGNGWGLSIDGGVTWRNWAYEQLGPEWQYVAPSGIAIRGDTTMIATADGLQITTDDGGHWTAIGDRTGPQARGPADTVYELLSNEYVRRLATDRRGWNVTTLRGNQRLRHSDSGWVVQPLKRGGVSAGQCGTHRPPAVPRDAMRPASHHRYAALSPERRRDAGAPGTRSPCG